MTSSWYTFMNQRCLGMSITGAGSTNAGMVTNPLAADFLKAIKLAAYWRHLSRNRLNARDDERTCVTSRDRKLEPPSGTEPSSRGTGTGVQGIQNGCANNRLQKGRNDCRQQEGRNDYRLQGERNGCCLQEGRNACRLQGGRNDCRLQEGQNDYRLQEEKNGCRCTKQNVPMVSQTCLCNTEHPQSGAYNTNDPISNDEDHSDLTGLNDTEVKEDNVVAILRNILHDLEKDIDKDRLLLKESRRQRREGRRLRREQRQATTMTSTVALSMTSDGTRSTSITDRHTFAVATTSPFPRKITLTKSESLHFNSQDHNSNGKHRGLRKHESFSYGNYSKASLIGTLKEVAEEGSSNRGTAWSSKGQGTSFGRSDWSRYSREPEAKEEIEGNAENDVTPMASPELKSADSKTEDTSSIDKFNMRNTDCSLTDKKALSLKRNIPARAGSVGRYDWSRHSRDPENEQVENQGKKKTVNYTDETTQKTPDEQNRTHLTFSDGESEARESRLSRKGRVEEMNLLYSETGSPLLRSKVSSNNSNTREHLKNKMRSFEILPTYRRQKMSTWGHSSFDQSEDGHSDTASVKTVESADDMLNASSESLLSYSSLPSSVDTVGEVQVSIDSETEHQGFSAIKDTLSKSNVENDDLVFGYNTISEMKNTKCKSNAEKCVPRTKPPNIRQSLPNLRTSDSDDVLQDPLKNCERKATMPKPPRTKMRKNRDVRCASASGSDETVRQASVGTSGYSTDDCSLKRNTFITTVTEDPNRLKMNSKFNQRHNLNSIQNNKYLKRYDTKLREM
ncbi:hypothetical protein MAR_004721 [Mya arenaria]|uniref:Uncharacterized protein n=1 Tax=Mya arenaria TaxID=6604 RepID=A0ABY7F157_MYAAR|nr:hypothetical protein MAR_004721 [Mya arenaria]